MQRCDRMKENIKYHLRFENETQICVRLVFYLKKKKENKVVFEQVGVGCSLKLSTFFCRLFFNA